jgi:hypothetical protein
MAFSLTAPCRRVGWDVRGPDDERIQVKYLANPVGRWVNEHEIRVNERMDSYAIVIYEALLPQAVIVFPKYNLEVVGAPLGKRSSNLDIGFWFTQANYRHVCNEIAIFNTLGIRLYLAPDWTLQ